MLKDEIKYLRTLANQQWTPVPRIMVEIEQREISAENKEIGKNEMRIKFKRVMMGPRGWYYITYVLNGVTDQRSSGSSDRAGILNYQDTISLTSDSKVFQSSIQ
jgi:hypothetical protein